MEYISIFLCLHAICLTTFLSESSVLCAEHNHVQTAQICGRLSSVAHSSSQIDGQAKPHHPNQRLPFWPSILANATFGYHMVLVPPNHPLNNRVFHYFHHPFWGTPIFGNTHICWWESHESRNNVEKDFGDDCRRWSFQYHSYKDSACTDVSATGCQKCLKV